MASSELIVTDELYDGLEKTLKALKGDKIKLYRAIVDLPFENTKEMGLLFMGFLCYLSVDREAEQLKLESATDNDYYRESVADYDFEHTSFVVPFTASENSMVKAAVSGEPVSLTNWDDMRRPGIEEGVARLNQATSGIAYTVIMPIDDKGVLGFNFFQPKESLPQASEDFLQRYSELVARVLS